MPDKKRVLVPSRGYDIQVKIADLDYTTDVYQVRIISNIINSYQVISITMLLDPNDIIRERIYGKEPIKMTIRYIGRGSVQSVALEEFSFELINLSSNSQIGSMVQSPTNKQKELKLVTFITVPKEPFRTISTSVNDIFYGKTVKEIIESLVSNSNSELIYDTEDQNSDVVEQVLIPPTTLYNSILYLDNTFGLFDGACNLGFCQYDNKLYIMNLTKRLSKSQQFTIYHLSNTTDTGKIIEKCNDGKNFYSYSEFSTNYNGNSIFSTKAMQVKHIFKPTDSLYRTFDQDMTQFTSSYGVICKNSDIDFDSLLIERESYRTTQTGNDKSDIVANARVARQLISLSTITIKLERNLQVMNLMKVGEPVKLIPQTSSFVDLSGKYLLKSSDIMFTKQTKDWMSIATIVLCRTNKTI